jgi:hypothetical protein
VDGWEAGRIVKAKIYRKIKCSDTYTLNDKNDIYNIDFQMRMIPAFGYPPRQYNNINIFQFVVASVSNSP